MLQPTSVSHLPLELLMKIFEYVGTDDLVTHISGVCGKWQEVVDHLKSHWIILHANENWTQEYLHAVLKNQAVAKNVLSLDTTKTTGRDCFWLTDSTIKLPRLYSLRLHYQDWTSLCGTGSLLTFLGRFPHLRILDLGPYYWATHSTLQSVSELMAACPNLYVRFEYSGEENVLAQIKRGLQHHDRIVPINTVGNGS